MGSLVFYGEAEQNTTSTLGRIGFGYASSGTALDKLTTLFPIITSRHEIWGIYDRDAAKGDTADYHFAMFSAGGTDNLTRTVSESLPSDLTFTSVGADSLAAIVGNSVSAATFTSTHIWDVTFDSGTGLADDPGDLVSLAGAASSLTFFLGTGSGKNFQDGEMYLVSITADDINEFTVTANDGSTTTLNASNPTALVDGFQVTYLEGGGGATGQIGYYQ